MQYSLALRSNQKLAFKYFGPFKILARVGQVAYKLDLPSSSSIHPVFHVSQLKPALTATAPVSASLPTDIATPRVPEKILQKRFINKGISPVQQVLVKWSDWPEDLATWEGLLDHQQRFPNAPAWGQASSQDGGDVSTTATGPRARPNNKRVLGPEWVNVLACT